MFDDGSVDTLDGNGRAERVEHANVADADVTEAAVGARTELNGTGRAAYFAVAHVDAVVAAVGIVRFQADAVVGAVDAAAGHGDALAVGQVDAVVIPVGAVVEVDAANGDVSAHVEREAPVGTVAQKQLFNAYAVGLGQIEEGGAHEFAGAHAPCVVVGVDVGTGVVQTVGREGKGQSLPVYCALARETDVAGAVGDEETQVCIVHSVGLAARMRSDVEVVEG